MFFLTKSVKTAICIAVLAVVLYFARPWFNGPMCESDVRLDGKVVIVTGANAGIGFETAIDLVARGARVYLGCRSVERGETAAKHIEERTGESTDKFPVLHLDLSSLKSVKNFVYDFKRREDRLDILINNAGVALIMNRMVTEDGFEYTLGVNHLGHFLLTNLLLDLLISSAPSRVVTVSGDVYTSATINFDDLMLEQEGAYGPLVSLKQSKLANILFSTELARRLKGTGVTTYSLTPGAIQTEGFRNLEPMKYPVVKQFMEYVAVYAFKDVLHGAQTTVCCAVDPKLQEETGKHYKDCREVALYAPALDEDVARHLWEISEQLVKLPKQAHTQT